MVYLLLTSLNGHFYVSGDYRMAEDVATALKIVFQKIGGLSLKESETLLAKLKVPIFLISLIHLLVLRSDS